MSSCPQCGEHRTLFWLPGQWEGGICEPCAAADPVIGPAFSAHFGSVEHVSDGETAHGKAKS